MFARNIARVLKVAPRVLPYLASSTHVPRAPLFHTPTTTLITRSTRWRDNPRGREFYWYPLLFGATSALSICGSVIFADNSDEKSRTYDARNPLSVTEENFQEVLKMIAADDPKLYTLYFTFLLDGLQISSLKNAIQTNSTVGFIKWRSGQAEDNKVRDVKLKLKQNNMTYGAYPSDSVCAHIASDVYQTRTTGDGAGGQIPEGWIVAEVFNDVKGTSHYAAIYVNHRERQVVLATRGSQFSWDDTKDWQNNLDGVVAGKIVPQMEEQYKAAKKAWEFAEEKGYSLLFTGHSLGAWLSQLGLHYYHLHHKKEGTVGRGARAVVFDSPGAKDMMETLQSNMVQERVDVDAYDITTYLAAPNPVNCIGQHVGRVYMILDQKMPKSEQFNSNGWPDYNGILHGIIATEGHSLGSFLHQFDISTRAPQNVVCMSDWPRIKYNGKDSFTKQGRDAFKQMLNKIGAMFSTNSSTNKQPFLPVSSILYAVKTNIGSIFVNLVDAFLQDSSPFNSTLFSIAGLAIALKSGQFCTEQYFTFYENMREGSAAFKEFELMHKAHFSPKKHESITLKSDNPSHKLLQKLKKHKHRVLAPYIDHGYEIANTNHHYELRPGGHMTISDVLRLASRVATVFPQAELDSTSMHPNLYVNDSIPKNIAKGFDLFVGRVQEMYDIADYFQQNTQEPRILLLQGQSGSGKSTIAAYYINEAKKKDGNLEIRWLRADDKSIFLSFLELARDMGIEIENQRQVHWEFSKSDENREIKDLRDRIYEAIAKDPSRFVIILDNVEKSEHVDLLLAGLPRNVNVIVTSKADISPLHTIHIKELSNASVREYLQGRDKDMFDDASIESILFAQNKIAQPLIKKFPIEIQNLAQLLSKEKWSTVDDIVVRLTEYGMGATMTHAMISGLTHRSLAAKDTLIKITCFGSIIPKELLAEVLGDEMESRIEELEREGVIYRNREEKYLVMHEEIHNAAKGILKKENLVTAEIVTEITDALLRLVSHIEIAEYRIKDVEKAKRLRPSAVALVEDYEDDIPERKLYLVLSMIGNTYAKSFEHAKALEYNLRALESARKFFKGDSDQHSVAAILNNIGHTYSDLDKAEDALKYYTLALEMAQKLHPSQDHKDVATFFNNIGSAYHALVQPKGALKYYTLALEMRRRLYQERDHADIADSLSNIGSCYLDLIGEKEQALKYHKEAVEMRQRLYPNQDHPDTADLLYNLGNSYAAQDDQEKAIKYHEAALAMRLRLYPNQDHPYIANSLYNLGSAYSHLDDHKKAVEYYKKSIEIRQKIYKEQDHPYTASSFNNLGNAYSHICEPQKALESHKKALEMRQRLYKGQDHQHVANSLYNVAGCYKDLDETDTALEYYNKHLEMLQRLYKGQDRSDIADSLYDIGALYSYLGNPQEAIIYSAQALEMMQRLSHVQDHTYIARYLHNVGLAYKKTYPTKCDIYLKMAYELARNIGDTDLAESIKSCVEINENAQEARPITRYGRSTHELVATAVRLATELSSLSEGVLSRKSWDDIKDQIDSYSSTQEQMLAFEAVAIGIASMNAPVNFALIKRFAQAYPELIRQIAKEHPEFFIDGTIAEACAQAMTADDAQYIRDKVPYQGQRLQNKEPTIN